MRTGLRSQLDVETETTTRQSRVPRLQLVDHNALETVGQTLGQPEMKGAYGGGIGRGGLGEGTATEQKLGSVLTVHQDRVEAAPFHRPTQLVHRVPR